MAKSRIDLPNEIWKPVVGYEGRYEASNLGRVWSIPTGHYRTGVILKPCLNRGGYPYVSLRSYQGASPVNRPVHSLVATAFHGPCPSGLQCAHRDGDKLNPAADNLEWVTALENHSHKRVHETQTRGFVHPPNKLTEGQVLQIRQRYRDGERGAAIADDLGISPETVRKIAVGITYPDFQPETICPRRPVGFRLDRAIGRQWMQDAGVKVDCRKR